LLDIHKTERCEAASSREWEQIQEKIAEVGPWNCTSWWLWVVNHVT